MARSRCLLYTANSETLILMGIYVNCKHCGKPNPRGVLECGSCERTLVDVSPISPAIIGAACAVATLASWWLTARFAPEVLVIGAGSLITTFFPTFLIMMFCASVGDVERRSCIGAAVGATIGVAGFLIIAGELFLTLLLSGFAVGLIASVCAHYVIENST